MQKTEQVLELERVLGVELRDAGDHKPELAWEYSETKAYVDRNTYLLTAIQENAYLLNNEQEIVGLSLSNIPTDNLKILRTLPFLEVLMLTKLKEDFIFLTRLASIKTLLLSEIETTFDFLSGFDLTESLFISKSNLTTVPSFSNLRQLKNLYLFRNQIQDIFALAELEQLESLYLIENKIQDISPLTKLKKLKSLDLRKNKIQDISALAELKELTSIDLRSNPIQDFSPLAELEQIKDLDLSESKIQDISSLVELRQFESLNLRGNQIQDISALVKLKQLLRIDLSENEIHDISSLAELKQLKSLDLKENNIQDISYLVELKQFERLNLSSNQIQDISSLAELEQLLYLDLSENEIQDISSLAKLKQLKRLDLRDNQIQDISPLLELQQLKNHDLRNNQIQDISPLVKLKQLKSFDLRNNPIKDFSPLAELKQFQSLDLSYSQIQDISSLAELKHLKSLDLSGNNIQDISSLTELKQLKNLHLSNNQIQDISPLVELKQLNSLDLRSNQIQDISPSFLNSFEQLTELFITRNPIKNIPKGVYDQYDGSMFPSDKNALQAVHEYLKDKEKGKTANNEVKLLLIGNGSVGKTQIAKRLVDQENFVFNSQHDSTHGIALLQRELDGLSLNIWDFAGQDIYHATHRVFMQTRALFVLVWDLENETSPSHTHNGRSYKNEKLLYWLEYCACFSKDSPILVIQNKVDEMDQQAFKLYQKEAAYYKENYPIIDFIQVSAKTGYNFDVLSANISDSFQANEKLKQDLQLDLPTSWVSIRNLIRDLQKQDIQTISLTEFETICEDHQVASTYQVILNYLHDTGVLYYRQGYFGNRIILDQAWAIDAIYAILNRESLYARMGKIKNGKLHYEDIQAIWTDNSDEERKLFIEFMLSAELCFETSEKRYGSLQERTFVVPSLLSLEMPEDVEFEMEEGDFGKFKEVIEYRFLPTVFIHRFIIKAEDFSGVEYMWQHGLMLVWNEFTAVVQADYELRQITISANDAFLIQKILEELDGISDEGNVRAQVLEHGDDIVPKGERFLKRGLDVLRKEKRKVPVLNVGEIRDLISQAKMGEALEVGLGLAERMGNPDTVQSFRMLLQRFRRNEKDFRAALITFEVFNVEINNISKALEEELNDLSS